MPRFARVCGLCGILLLSALVGCGPAVALWVLPELPASDAASKAMELYDANHDGFLDEKELEKAPGLRAAIKEVNTAHNGKISQQEIAARIQSWADSRAGRVTFTCRVLRNGKPLVGAKVQFVPERFLGDAIQSGSGKVSKSGVATINSPYPDDPKVGGLSPGFYRVLITKDGEKIPAKYNTETTLGAEAANGSQADQHGMKFDLEY